MAQKKLWPKVKPLELPGSKNGKRNPLWRSLFIGTVMKGSQKMGTPPILRIGFLMKVYPPSSASIFVPEKLQSGGHMRQAVYWAESASNFLGPSFRMTSPWNWTWPDLMYPL